MYDTPNETSYVPFPYISEKRKRPIANRQPLAHPCLENIKGISQFGVSSKVMFRQSHHFRDFDLYSRLSTTTQGHNFISPVTYVIVYQYHVYKFAP